MYNFSFSPRNLFILGFSLFMGLVVPTWVKENENLINTGSDIVDQVFIVMLDTSNLSYYIQKVNWKHSMHFNI